jgi:hypothetical protein
MAGIDVGARTLFSILSNTFFQCLRHIIRRDAHAKEELCPLAFRGFARPTFAVCKDSVKLSSFTVQSLDTLLTNPTNQLSRRATPGSSCLVFDVIDDETWGRSLRRRGGFGSCTTVKLTAACRQESQQNLCPKRIKSNRKLRKRTTPNQRRH